MIGVRRCPTGWAVVAAMLIQAGFSKADDVQDLLDANSAAVRALAGFKCQAVATRGDTSTDIEFVTDGERVRAVVCSNSEATPGGPGQLSCTKFVLAGDKMFAIRAPIDLRKERLPARDVNHPGEIAPRPLSCPADIRQTMLLLHGLTGVPGSRLYDARELAKRSKAVLLSRSSGKPELTFSFAGDTPLDVETLTLQLDPATFGLCTRRVVKFKNGVTIETKVESFLEYSPTGALPKRIVVKDSTSPSGLVSTVDLSYAELGQTAGSEFEPPFHEDSYVHDRTKNIFLVWGKGGPVKSMTVADFAKVSGRGQRTAAPRLKASADWITLAGWTVGSAGLLLTAWLWIRGRT